ncbi:MAG: carbon storage regulator CsrA [Turneriella sp.]|nr:carbon storage regulator CsrA [Leptospiraceae bacterium]MCX7633075.1 carbon storage regulator CsrA [Turneriella sp.]
MLVLARRVNDSIVIGDNIEIVVVEIKGDQVKLGVKAPRELKVFRGEIYAEIQKENKAASESQVPGDLDRFLKKSP